MSWTSKVVKALPISTALLKIISRMFFDDWLSSNTTIANAIVWRDDAHMAGVSYASWTDTQKSQLFETYWKITQGPDLGLSGTPTCTVTLDNSGSVWSTNLDHDLAWSYYLGYVAQSIWAERSGKVPWSLSSLSSDELGFLFDSHSLFEWGTGPQKYVILQQHNLLFDHGTATPGDPVRTFQFLIQNSLLGATATQTVGLLLDWCRQNLIHYYGGNDPANLQATWQYTGFPPVERVISGTTHPQYGQGHWTAGCWGTTGFLRAVLRTANIPVKLEKKCDHALPHFLHEALYLSHGDDPYNAWSKAKPQFPIGDLPIDQAKFDAWFGANLPDSTICGNIGKRPYELTIQCLPYDLLKKYCADVTSGKDHASGSVYGSLEDHYSLSELEAFNLWGKMDAKIAALGGCNNIPN
jgi:hypothetical protein